MHTREIRKFRRVLRRFERITNAQLKSCCAQVSLAQCLVLLEIDENPSAARHTYELERRD